MIHDELRFSKCISLIVVLPCPNNCTAQGICQSGVCECRDGFSGLDCAYDSSLPPFVDPSTSNIWLVQPLRLFPQASPGPHILITPLLSLLHPHSPHRHPHPITYFTFNPTFLPLPITLQLHTAHHQPHLTLSPFPRHPTSPLTLLSRHTCDTSCKSLGISLTGSNFVQSYCKLVEIDVSKTSEIDSKLS